MHKIILASQSRARREMLQAAGVKFECEPAAIDEQKILRQMQQEDKTPEEIAQKLACEKALSISKTHPFALVIGSDQILECEGKIISKAEDESEARKKIIALQGKTHRLISAVCIAFEGKIIFSHTGFADLKMRKLSEELLNAYCKSAGDILTSCVGAYAIEGRGAWLFETISGDHFTIMGMPLLPLLKFLHDDHGVLP